MYSISGYGKMIADEDRMGAYCRALQRAIGPDSVVIDIGAGTGILSLLACQYGARKVYAVEPSSAIGVAQEAARTNGFADRMECIGSLSTEMTLSEKANVIVSDLRGVLPLFQQHIPSIVDARRRLLASGGNLIPKRDVLWAAIVEMPEHYDGLAKPWERFDLNMEAASQLVTNSWKKIMVRSDQLLTEPQRWATIDYLTVESPHVAAEMSFQLARPGTAHGFVVWFDAVLDEGIEFSNAPGQPELIYGSGFFPWSSPVSLPEDDTVLIDLRADLVGGDYVWSWETRVYGRADESGRPKAHFRQSTFLAAPLSPVQLRKRGSRYQPTLKKDGEIDLQILQLMDGTRSNEKIAQLIAERFSANFPCQRDALTRIADLAEKYSK